MHDQFEIAMREAIASQPALAGQCQSIAIELHPDVVVLDGQVDTIAAKRRLALLAARTAGGLGVHDCVRVASSDVRKDDEIAAKLIDALTQEPVFRDYRVLPLPYDAATLKDGEADDDAVLGIGVRTATVRLVGTVGSLTHRRFAEVLGWWTPGTTDVDNRLYVLPREEDSDEEVTNAVRIALDKDPWLDADRLDVRTQDREVRLAGVLPSAEQRHRAECDAWYVRGVHGVRNDIESEC